MISFIFIDTLPQYKRPHVRNTKPIFFMHTNLLPVAVSKLTEYLSILLCLLPCTTHGFIPLETSSHNSSLEYTDSIRHEIMNSEEIAKTNTCHSQSTFEYHQLVRFGFICKYDYLTTSHHHHITYLPIKLNSTMGHKAPLT